MDRMVRGGSWNRLFNTYTLCTTCTLLSSSFSSLSTSHNFRPLPRRSCLSSLVVLLKEIVCITYRVYDIIQKGDTAKLWICVWHSGIWRNADLLKRLEEGGKIIFQQRPWRWIMGDLETPYSATGEGGRSIKILQENWRVFFDKLGLLWFTRKRKAART